MQRHPNNPLITPEMIKPSAPGYRVLGAFNPGAVRFGDEIILLLRVSENVEAEEGMIAVPMIEFEDNRGKPGVLKLRRDDPEVNLKDTRGVVYRGVDYLSTLSHIRVARSRDGVNFTVDDEPFIFPANPSERFGCEDARVIKIDDTYYINYTCVSEDSWATALATTHDFRKVERLGIIFHPENKDVSIFPEKIGGMWRALHRPNNNGFGKPSIWYAESPDLIHWGNHKCILHPRDIYYEQEKIGAGAPSIKTDEGWLQIYHGKSYDQVYSLFALLLDLEDPSKVIAQGDTPLLLPQAPYEKEGFFNNVIFSNGIVPNDDGTLYIYYGACDGVTALAVSSVDEILASLK